MSKICYFCEKAGHEAPGCPDKTEFKEAYSATNIAFRDIISSTFEKHGINCGTMIKHIQDSNWYPDWSGIITDVRLDRLNLSHIFQYYSNAYRKRLNSSAYSKEAIRNGYPLQYIVQASVTNVHPVKNSPPNHWSSLGSTTLGSISYGQLVWLNIPIDMFKKTMGYPSKEEYEYTDKRTNQTVLDYAEFDQAVMNFRSTQDSSPLALNSNLFQSSTDLDILSPVIFNKESLMTRNPLEGYEELVEHSCSYSRGMYNSSRSIQIRNVLQKLLRTLPKTYRKKYNIKSLY